MRGPGIFLAVLGVLLFILSYVVSAERIPLVAFFPLLGILAVAGGISMLLADRICSRKK